MPNRSSRDMVFRGSRETNEPWVKTISIRIAKDVERLESIIMKKLKSEVEVGEWIYVNYLQVVEDRGIKVNYRLENGLVEQQELLFSTQLKS